MCSYYSNAVQIIPPHDAGIASAIDKHLDIDAAAWEVDGVIDSALCVDRTEDMKDAYFEMVAGLATRSKYAQSGSSLHRPSDPMSFVEKSIAKRLSFSPTHLCTASVYHSPIAPSYAPTASPNLTSSPYRNKRTPTRISQQSSFRTRRRRVRSSLR